MVSKIAAACCALLLPAAALAVTEGVIESAPPVAMEEISLPAWEFYLPDESCYAGVKKPGWDQSERHYEPVTTAQSRLYGREEPYLGRYLLPVDSMKFTVCTDTTTLPQLTAGEQARAGRLLEAYEADEAAGDGEGVLGRMEDVVVGVYALNPEDFDGERVYVLLPGTCLTDEQILALIDAYHRLGLTFDPAGLCYRNCARGGGRDNCRDLSAGENARYEALSDMLTRGMIADAADMEESVICPAVDPPHYGNGRMFSILPYRPMTDGELLSLLAAEGVRGLGEAVDLTAAERLGREILCGRLGCPISMERHGIDDRQISFEYTDGRKMSAVAVYDAGMREVIHAAVTELPPIADSTWERAPELSDEVCGEIARAYAQEKLGRGELVFRVTREAWIAWGLCVEVCAQEEDGMWLNVYIGAGDGQAHGVSLSKGMPEDIEKWMDGEEEGA